MIKLTDESTFVDQVVRFLELQPGLEVLHVSAENDNEGVKILIRHGTVSSMLQGVGNDMTIARAALWSLEVLGVPLGDVWNCDRVTAVDSETQERMDA
jgi:hypothetical protein